MTLVSDAEAEALHSAIVRKEAWTLDPVRRLRADAERRSKEGPWSVTTERPQGIAMDIHEFYSEAPYWWPQSEDPTAPYIRRDGQTNPNRFMANKNALVSMCDAVFALGSAAYFLDDPRYAQRAARDINTWFINPKTRMTPSLEYAQAIRNVNSGRGAGIVDGRLFIRAIQGMEFLAQTDKWDAKDQAAVRKWFQEYLHWLTTSDYGNNEKGVGNNHASWWTAQVAAIAGFVEDDVQQKAAFNHYRDHIFPRQIKPDGAAPREEARTRSLWYSAFNLEAFVTVCRIAQLKGVDLWSVHAKGGATISTVIDYLKPYLADPKKWTKEQVVDFSNDGLYSLAFAGMGLKNPEYIALFRKLEHPEGAWLSVVDLMVGRYEASGHQTRH
jgi:Alginate lyase